MTRQLVGSAVWVGEAVSMVCVVKRKVGRVTRVRGAEDG
jgi:hypothetical protein